MIEEIKTATHEGNVYEIGKLYAFSDEGKEWEYDILVGFHEDRLDPFIGEIDVWQLIRIIESSELGTITPVPIELIDGAAYMFDYQAFNHPIWQGVGLYEKDEDSFFMVGYSYNLENCTNIRLMTVESK